MRMHFAIRGSSLLRFRFGGQVATRMPLHRLAQDIGFKEGKPDTLLL
jgi:hypothetical protein